MADIEWAMWANELAVTTSAILLLSSIICICGMFKLWQFGIYGVVISIIIAAIEWPRSKRKSGSTMERKFQRVFAIMVNKFGILGRHYGFRSILYLLFGVPLFWTLSTLLSAVCLLFTAGIYLVAAKKGEKWCPTNIDKQTTDTNRKQVKNLEPPKKPPPRPTQSMSNLDEVGVDNVAMEVMEERPKPLASRPTRPPPQPKQGPGRLNR